MTEFLLWAFSASPVAVSCLWIGYQSGRKSAEKSAQQVSRAEDAAPTGGLTSWEF